MSAAALLAVCVFICFIVSRPITTVLWLWPATDHVPHCRHVPIKKIWRWTKSIPRNRWWCSHMAGIYSDCSTHKLNNVIVSLYVSPSVDEWGCAHVSVCTCVCVCVDEWSSSVQVQTRDCWQSLPFCHWHRRYMSSHTVCQCSHCMIWIHTHTHTHNRLTAFRPRLPVMNWWSLNFISQKLGCTFWWNCYTLH